MVVKAEISVGDILTIISIVVSVIALLISWHTNQELKRKEFADKIRHGASTVVVKLQRWRELMLRFFEDIQPLITEADMELVRNQKIIDIRDIFWQKLSDIRTKLSQRIVDEQVETAYIDLYGFDPRIQILFSEVINRLKVVDKSIYSQTLNSTQSDILSLRPPFYSSQLGNELRNTCHLIAEDCRLLMDEAIEPFCKEMIRLIEQNDIQIVKRRFNTSSVSDLFPVSLDQLEKDLNARANNNLLSMGEANVIRFFPMEDVELCEQFKPISDNLRPVTWYGKPIGSINISPEEFARITPNLHAVAKKIKQLEEKKQIDRQALEKFNPRSMSQRKQKRK